MIVFIIIMINMFIYNDKKKQQFNEKIKSKKSLNKTI